MNTTPFALPFSAPPSLAAVSLTSSFRSTDLGFSRWETIELCEQTPIFDVYFARPRRRLNSDPLSLNRRGTETPCVFLLKALKPRFCGALSGAALIEREIFLGSLSCPRLSPIVDFVRPRRLSPTEARRGCVVFPYFPGQTLAQRLAVGETFSSPTVSAIERQLKTAISALNRSGWSIGNLTPERVLLSDAPSTNAEPVATLIDFSNARRFVAPSLISAAPLGDETEFEPTFDPRFELPPNVFFDANASAEKDRESLRRLTRRLRGATGASQFENLRVA